MVKKLVLGRILAHLAQIRAASFFVFCCFFSKICLGQSLYIMVGYHHVQYQKKEQKIIQS